jgi:hypothetical protein
MVGITFQTHNYLLCAYKFLFNPEPTPLLKQFTERRLFGFIITYFSQSGLSMYASCIRMNSTCISRGKSIKCCQWCESLTQVIDDYLMGITYYNIVFKYHATTLNHLNNVVVRICFCDDVVKI